jgi:hypothetical protein
MQECFSRRHKKSGIEPTNQEKNAPKKGKEKTKPSAMDKGKGKVTEASKPASGKDQRDASRSGNKLMGNAIRVEVGVTRGPSPMVKTTAQKRPRTPEEQGFGEAGKPRLEDMNQYLRKLIADSETSFVRP